MSTDGGGDGNKKCGRVQACVLCLVMKFNLEKLLWEKKAAGSSVWNPDERRMASISRAFANASVFRVETSTNLEHELIRKNSCGALLESNQDLMIKEAHAQSITPEIKQMEEMTSNCACDKKNINI